MSYCVLIGSILFQFELLKNCLAAEYMDTNLKTVPIQSYCVCKNFYAIKFLSQGNFPTGKNFESFAQIAHT